jgi:hypothetical protein
MHNQISARSSGAALTLSSAGLSPCPGSLAINSGIIPIIALPNKLKLL